jgi:glycosyltransferase involved in cell wall biosynthesis
MWPEGAIQMGLLQNKTVQKIAYFIEKTCYKAATRIVTLSPGAKKEIEERFGMTKVESVPNASDNTLFSGDTSSFVVPDYLQGKKLFLYTGNIGKVNNSWLVVKAAEILKNEGDDRAFFLFIGDGQQREEIQQYITDKNLNNMLILGLMPKSDLVAYVQRAFFMLVPLEGKPILDTSSPNKLFDALAAGIPAIQNTQGWIKELLDTENCGFTIPYNRPDELARRCKEMMDNPALRDEMAVNAKRTAIEQFDRDMLSEKMHKVLLEAKNA